MMKTTKCSKCDTVSQSYTKVYVPVQIVVCERCAAREASTEAMSFTVANTFGTKTAFVPDFISR